MAALAPFVPYLTAAGTAVAVIGAVRQGQAAAASADYNAKIAQQNAQIAEGQGAAAGESQQRDAARRIGAAEAAYGASGVQLSDGSPLDVLEQSARESALDAATLKYNYKIRGMGFTNQAGLYSAQSGFASTAGTLNAGAAVLSGTGQAIKFGG